MQQATRRCTHCALLVPADRRSSEFCCAGCEAVHTLLRERGLTRFYDLGGAAAGAVGPVPRASTLDWLPELERRQAGADGVVRLALDVQGLRCAACVWLLQELWKRQPGSLDLRIDPSLGRASLVYRGGSGVAQAFLADAARFGYPMAPATKAPVRDIGLLVRLGICSALAMNAMILAVANYFGLSEGPEFVLFGWVSLGLATGSVVVGGPVFFRGALAGLRAGMVHMDLPISLGLLLAYAGSVYGQLAGRPVYFDTVALFTAFMLGGRFLQQRTLSRNRDQVLADDGAEHLRARRLAAQGIEVVPVAQLRAGDALLLAPGDLVPVRCALQAEAASFSLDWISGEAEPRAYARGDEVPAGAFQAGRVAVQVEARDDYLGSGLAELLAAPPRDAEDTRGKVRFWHRWSSHYAVVVLAASLLAGLLWWWIDAARALPVAISVLVITCPCAVGIATPLAFHLAMALLRRRGVFVRSSTLLDKLRLVRKVVFDKTGTVTFGGMRAEVVQPVPVAWRAAVATMVASSNHPVSQAIAQALGPAGFDPALAVSELPGQGLEAVADGRRLRLGHAAFATDGRLPAAAESCVFTVDGEVQAGFRLEEDFRSGAAAEIAALRSRGLDVHLFSGDRPQRVQTAAQALGIAAAQAHGGMSPQDKAAALQALDRDDTMMVGDGINDAPAFAAAFCAGTPAMDRPVLPSRADFFFRGAQSGAVRDLFAVADLHRAVTRSNLLLSIAYNSTTLLVCFAGMMTPVLCAVLMPLSSLALVLHTGTRFGRARRRAA